MTLSNPAGLGVGGTELWDAISEANELDVSQQVQLLEACRAKDRLDKLDALLRGDADMWLSVKDFEDGRDSVLVINSALDKANTTANLLKQLLAALRLPDETTGRKPQYRGPRGANAPKVPTSGRVSSLDRARAAKSS